MYVLAVRIQLTARRRVQGPRQLAALLSVWSPPRGPDTAPPFLLKPVLSVELSGTLPPVHHDPYERRGQCSERET